MFHNESEKSPSATWLPVTNGRKNPTTNNTKTNNLIAGYIVENTMLGGHGYDYQSEVLRTAEFKNIQFGATGGTTLIDNNASTNNTNNTNFRLELLNDSTGFPVQFTSSYSQSGYISTYWIFTLMNGVTIRDWARTSPTANIKPGVGYTQKGTGNTGTEEQYVFGDEDGTLIGRVFDYILREGGDSENFEWRFDQYYR